MTLHVKDAATLFEVPEKTLYRWIAGNELPHQKVRHQYRFNRTELLAWATPGWPFENPPLMAGYSCPIPGLS